MSVENINFIIGIVGFILSLFGFYFTYISFVNPIIRFKKLLAKPENWEQLFGSDENIGIYRHKMQPNFQIVIKWNEKIVENFNEEWIMVGLLHDKNHNTSNYVRLEANGMLLQTEIFVSLDGYRYFVPLPKIQGIIDGQRYFYYNQFQIKLVKIIGKFDCYNNIYDFVKQQKFLNISEY